MSSGYVFDRVGVGAYVRGPELVLVPCSLCVSFQVYFEPEWEVLAVDDQPDVMGIHVQRAFARCRTHVTAPPILGDAFAKSLGAKSWTDLTKRMEKASLGRNMRESAVDIRNTIPKGRNGAFGSFHRVVDLHDTQGLGQALWDALRTTT